MSSLPQEGQAIYYKYLQLIHTLLLKYRNTWSFSQSSECNQTYHNKLFLSHPVHIWAYFTLCINNNIWRILVRIKCRCKILYIGNFSRREFWRKWHLEGVLNFHRVIFSLFQGLSMKRYSRVYFSLCLFLAISGRSRTQRKLNPREKFPIYGIAVYRICIRSLKSHFLWLMSDIWWWSEVVIPPANKVWGYIGITLSVCPCLSLRLFTSCPDHNFLPPCPIWIFHMCVTFLLTTIEIKLFGRKIWWTVDKWKLLIIVWPVVIYQL